MKRYVKMLVMSPALMGSEIMPFPKGIEIRTIKRHSETMTEFGLFGEFPGESDMVCPMFLKHVKEGEPPFVTFSTWG